jgi:hypothetical protein
MTTYSTEGGRRAETSGWVGSAIGFAGTLLVLAGVFQALAGLTAIFNDSFYVVTRNYTYDLDVTAWGWIHLLVGIGLVATAWGLFTRSTWAGVAAIVIAGLSAIVNFMFIPYYPFWSLLVIALDVWVIWALTRPGALQRST